MYSETCLIRHALAGREILCQSIQDVRLHSAKAEKNSQIGMEININ